MLTSKSTLFPYTTLFRSGCACGAAHRLVVPSVRLLSGAREAGDDDGRGTDEPAVPHRRRPTSGGIRSLDRGQRGGARQEDRKSTRLNSSHLGISYAVFCL